MTPGSKVMKEGEGTVSISTLPIPHRVPPISEPKPVLTPLADADGPKVHTVSSSLEGGIISSRAATGCHPVLPTELQWVHLHRLFTRLRGRKGCGGRQKRWQVTAGAVVT